MTRLAAINNKIQNQRHPKRILQPVQLLSLCRLVVSEKIDNAAAPQSDYVKEFKSAKNTLDLIIHKLDPAPVDADLFIDKLLAAFECEEG